MANVDYDGPLRDYSRRITGPSDESNLIKSVPWSLGSPADLDALLRGLQLEAARFRELPEQLKFSLIAPLSDTPSRSLDELILSVRCQSWFRWELLLIEVGRERRGHPAVASRWAERDDRIRILRTDRGRGRIAAKNAGLEAATGDFVCLIDDDALLHPSALGIFARQANAAKEVNLIFSHEARLEHGTSRIGRRIRKPDFDLFTLLRTNYIGNLAAIRTELLRSSREGGEVFREGCEGVEDHDLMIRLALSGKVRSLCLPFFLYYGRSAPGRDAPAERANPDAGRRTVELIEEYLPRIYPGASWVIIPPSAGGGNQHPGIHLRSIAGIPNPSVLGIIPFKDQPDVTVRCLDSIERQEHELDIEMILVNNRSRDPETARILGSWLEGPRRHRYRLVDDDGAFNYARLNNAVFDRFGRARDLVLFMNNDTELLSPDCLQTMAIQAMADEACGIVGMRLLYPEDGTVQHGGIKIWDNLLAVCGYHQIDHARAAEEYVDDERIAFGVTFAVAMMRRTTFERLGKLEEFLYPNAYGDVAICARSIEAGLNNYYFGTLVGLHYELKSRGRSHEDVEYVAVCERHGRILSHWMTRSLAYSGPSDAASHRPHTSSLPLRYKIADRINDTLKAVLGPVHPTLKSGLHRSTQLVPRIRSKGVQGRPSKERGPAQRPQDADPAIRGPHLERAVARGRESVGSSIAVDRGSTADTGRI